MQKYFWKIWNISFAHKKLKKPPQKVALYLWQLGVFFLCSPDRPKKPRFSFPFNKSFEQPFCIGSLLETLLARMHYKLVCVLVWMQLLYNIGPIVLCLGLRHITKVKKRKEKLIQHILLFFYVKKKISKFDKKKVR